MPTECENCKANPVEIARNTQGTPTAKLIAILEAQGITDAEELAEIVGITDRAIRKARNAGSGTQVPRGTTVPELQDRCGTQVPETRNSSSALARVDNILILPTNNKPTEVGIVDAPLTEHAQRSRGSRLPKTWVLPKSWGEWAQLNAGMTRDEILLEADKFRDFWVAKTKDATKLDWEATWRNWCRNRSSRRKYNPQQSAHDERKARLAAEGKPTTLREALAQRYAGAVQ